MSESPQNMAAKSDHKSPQLGAGDNFIPLGFSSPINARGRDDGDLYPSQQRNFDPHSANRRPNFRNNYRNRFQPHNRKSHDFRGPQHHQQQHYQKNHNRKPFHDHQQTPGGKREHNSQSFFHPSMLEDPWRSLVARHEMKNAEKNESSGRSPVSSEVSDEASKSSPAAATPVSIQDD